MDERAPEWVEAIAIEFADSATSVVAEAAPQGESEEERSRHARARVEAESFAVAIWVETTSEQDIRVCAVAQGAARCVPLMPFSVRALAVAIGSLVTELRPEPEPTTSRQDPEAPVDPSDNLDDPAPARRSSAPRARAEELGSPEPEEGVQTEGTDTGVRIQGGAAIAGFGAWRDAHRFVEPTLGIRVSLGMRWASLVARVFAMPGLTAVPVETMPYERPLGLLLEGGADVGVVLGVDSRAAVELTALGAVGAHEQRRWVDVARMNDSWYWSTYARAGLGVGIEFRVSRHLTLRGRLEGGALFRLAGSPELSIFLAPILGIEWG